MNHTSEEFLIELSKRNIYKSEEAWFLGDKAMAFGWEQPLMFEFAKHLNGKNTSILEIGFGMGVFCKEIIKTPINSYTLLEIHPELCQEARKLLNDTNIYSNIVNSSWQSYRDYKCQYDSIMYDPFSDKGCREDDLLLFSEKAAKKLLKENGKLGVFYADPFLDERVSSILLKYFEKINVHKVIGLNINEDFKKRGLTDYMLAVIAENPLKHKST